MTTYWNIGRIIVEYEQQNQIRADYGKQTLKELSKELTREFGKGFSRSNLQNMRAFYLAYEKCQTVSGKLSWSHYCELLSITDENKRSFYEKESVNSGWSVRELKRQIDSSLYERLLLSSEDVNKEKVLSLAQKGVEISQPADIIRQRKLSRMQKGSNNRNKQRLKVAKLHEKVSNQRKDFLHKQSRQIANAYDCVCIEDLDMKAMSRSLNFGKSVSDNGWGMFTTFLRYKLEEQGKKLVKVDRFFASSQTCSVCGYKNAKTKNLALREWDCPQCGTHHDRDVNAAVNIRNEGMRLVNA